jgi:thioredoxin-like negative regulator of GroEL
MGVLVTARAQRLDGRLDEAFATLAPLLTEDARDADGNRLAGEILMQQARALEDPEAMATGLRRARAYLAEAMQLDPLDQRVYLALDDSRRGGAGYPTANDVSTLEVAGVLAPQSAEVRMRLARAYLATGDARAAMIILGPVANAPHASSQRAAARTLLAEARQAAGLANDPELAAPGVGEAEDADGV